MSFLDKFKKFAKSNPKIAKLFAIVVIFYIFKRLRNSYRYKQKQLSQNEMRNLAVLITGCDTGFGYDTANKLHSMGFCVIATVLKQASADKFNNEIFQINNNSKSCSFVMDITKIDEIQKVKQKVEKHLNKNNIELWGLVNNAGVAPVGKFEMILPKYLSFYCNVLLMGHLNVIREFIPLIKGRHNCQIPSNNKKYSISANGGRIINIASASVHVPMHVFLLYGALKSAMTYVSHALRYELSPRFGIYTCAVEPEGYATNIWNATERMEKLKNEIDSNVWDIYDMDEEIKRIKEQLPVIKKGLHQSNDTVVNDIVHGLTAKYPNKVYRPGWRLPFKILTSLPMDTAGWLFQRQTFK